MAKLVKPHGLGEQLLIGNARDQVEAQPKLNFGRDERLVSETKLNQVDTFVDLCNRALSCESVVRAAPNHHDYP
jgi:hypothetical protein